MNKPVFVIGSPRSGTSILTWCLGQHSNILGQEESDWLGKFSLDAAAAYETGSRRGLRSHFGSLGVREDELFARLGRAINELVLGHREELTRIAREQALQNPDSPQIIPAFKTERAPSDPKQRWVDGTPEYSFYVFGLRKLFPDAVFIHLLRDVSAVVRSLLHFDAGGQALVENKEQAYDYWLRAVRACLRAEQAYGPKVVHRLRYAGLIEQPEAAFRSLFDFLGEPYEPGCLEPLETRINSSALPPEAAPLGETNPEIIEEARQLELTLSHESGVHNPAVAIELENEFRQRVHHNQNVNAYYRKSLVRIARLEKEKEELRAISERRFLWRNWFPGRKRP